MTSFVVGWQRKPPCELASPVTWPRNLTGPPTYTHTHTSFHTNTCTHLNIIDTHRSSCKHCITYIHKYEHHTHTHITIAYISPSSHTNTHTHTHSQFCVSLFLQDNRLLALTLSWPYCQSCHFHMCAGHKKKKKGQVRLEASLSWAEGSQAVCYKHRTHLIPTVSFTPYPTYHEPWPIHHISLIYSE